MTSSKFKAIAFKLLLWGGGIGAGVALVQTHRPLESLHAQQPTLAFLYAAEDCGASRSAIDHLRGGGLESIVVVPVVPSSDEWGREHCATALARLGGVSRLIWYHLAPSEYACEQLVHDAQIWHARHGDDRYPVWGLGDEPFRTGYTSENVDAVVLAQRSGAG